jgi:hypothetical protein
MTPFDRLEAKIDRVLELIEKQAGTAPATGHSTTTEGARFAPGTGTIGATHPDAPGPAVIPTDPAERAAILDRQRARRRANHPAGDSA